MENYPRFTSQLTDMLHIIYKFMFHLLFVHYKIKKFDGISVTLST